MSGFRGMRQEKEVKPRPRVIDMSKDASKDRFALPKANLIKSKSGSTLALGLQEKPCLRPMTTAYETTKRTENTHHTTITSSTPKGPRHDPYWAYIASTKEAERRRGEAAVAAQSTSRCLHTQYHSRVNQSPRVVEALTWSPFGIHTSAAQAASTSPIARPLTAPVPGSNLSWDVYSQRMYEVSSPRFVARKKADENRSVALVAAETTQSTVKQIQLQHHAKKKEAQEVQEATEAAVLKEWPHGLPATALTRSKREKLRVGGLGYGEVQSMPEEQYRALKSSIRLP